MTPATAVEERRRKMAALHDRIAQPVCSDQCRASAEWWRLHAEESAIPDQCHKYAAAMDRLADDMDARPRHYQRPHPNHTAWEWMSRQ
jgi:hypothetical protein